MTIIDPSARFRRNPLASAEEFIANEPTQASATMGATFQPATTDGEQAPMSTAEAAFKEAPAVATRLQDNVSALSDYGQRMIDIRKEREEEERRRWYVNRGGGSTGGYQGPVAGADIGDLNQSRQDVLRKTASYA